MVINSLFTDSNEIPPRVGKSKTQCCSANTSFYQINLPHIEDNVHFKKIKFYNKFSFKDKLGDTQIGS